MKKIRYGILLTVYLLGVTLCAQNIRGRAIMDTSEIRIGDQTRMVLELNKPANVNVQWPTIDDSINEHVQVASRSALDTLVTGDMQKITQSYLITSFDSGLYYIKPFFFVSNQNGEVDTVYTASLALSVQTIPVDTTKAFCDIKPLMEVRYTFRDLLPWLLLGLGIILLGAVIIYLVKRFTRKDDPDFLVKSKPLEPSYVLVLRELEQLQTEKVWRDGFYKQYYTGITDALRFYIEDRFDMDAKEMTSHEILAALKTKEIDKQLFAHLKELLTTSDLVKFAKVKPLAEENEKSIKYAVDFVENTKPEVRTLIDELEENENNKTKEPWEE